MFTEADYIKGIRSIYTDPREFNGINDKCCKCDNEVEDSDDVCYEHQLCEDCSEYNIDCNCQYLIDQYNRNREPKDWINNINEIDY